MKRCLLSLLLFTCYWHQTADAQTPKEALRLIREHLPKLVAAEQTHTRYFCERSLKDIRNRSLPARKYSVQRSGDSYLLQLENGFRVGSNADYLFTIEQNQKTQAWEIRQFLRTHRDNAEQILTQDRAVVIRPLTGLISGQSIEELITDTEFTAKSTSTRADGMLELAYERKLLTENGNKVRHEGAIVVDPLHHYNVVAQNYRLFMDERPKLNVRWTRTLETIGESLRCHSIQYSGIDNASGRQVANETYRFTNYSQETVDPALFKLDHYNLSVPNEAPEDQVHSSLSSGFLLLMFCGAVATLLAGWLAFKRFFTIHGR